MAAFDFKKEYKDLYLPKQKPSLIQVPAMKYFMVTGKGNPNTSGEYANALGILYGLSFTIKMSKKNGTQPPGYFDYVVPPLEGLWWTKTGGFDGQNITDKELFCWISMIRQPDFVDEDVYEQARAALAKKKPELDFSTTAFVEFEEGYCAQIMHLGPYDTEPESIERLNSFVEEQGLVTDITEPGAAFGNAVNLAADLKTYRLHHEIYLGDPRRTKPENLKTVIRHPVKKI